MRRIVLVFVIALVQIGCAKIPVQSVTLADALQTEGKRMHQINLALINSLFDAKSQALNTFITNEYAPAELANFKAALPAGTDYDKDFVELVQAITPKIESIRSEKQKILEETKSKLIEKLNTDYLVFDDAAKSLKDLLSSAVKLNAEKKALLDKAKSITGSKLNLEKLSNSIDQFIHKSGNTSAEITDLNNTINNF